MNIIVVHFRDISDFPPTQDLIKNLINLGHRIVLVTFDRNDYCKQLSGKIKCHILPFDSKKNRVQHLINYFNNIRRLSTILKEYKNTYNVLWTTTDSTVSALGKRIMWFDTHIMQLMELVFDSPRIPAQRLIKTGLKKYAQKANAVVVPEYNRAAILKAVWNLDNMPIVLPNKTSLSDSLPNSIVSAAIDKVLLLKKEGKKILLYQGIFSPERRLDEIEDCIEKNHKDFVMCIMGKDNNERKRICQKYPSIVYLGYIPSPLHICVTKEADFGLLIYDANRMNTIADKLNNIFCAPNKVYEFARFGIPMLGNNIPGLSYPFRIYDIGVTCNLLDKCDITNAIQRLIDKYSILSMNCKEFYSGINCESIIKNKILDKCKKE